MATVVRDEMAAVAERRPRVGWVLGGGAMIALVAVVTASVMALSHGPTARPVTVRPVPALWTQDELAVLRLVDQGVLPSGILEREPFRTKLLVNPGVLPREALEPRPAPAASLYCPEERAIMAAVAAGAVPKETLDDDAFLLKRLINQGLIPRQSAPPC